MPQGSLPTALPTDSTPNTNSATNWHLYLVDDNAQNIIPNTTITTAAIAQAATTASLSSATNVTVPAGTVLSFGGIQITIGGTDAALTSTPASIAIVAAPAAVQANSTATYTNLNEIPLGEQFNLTMPPDEETVKVFGRTTPVRTVNGKDLTMTARTLAGITDPVVKRLWLKGRRISPNNRVRVVLQASDGYAILATVNVNASLTGQPGQAQRWEFAMNLSGKMFDTNLNDTNPAWAEIGL